MEENLINRLEAAVARLERISVSGGAVESRGLDNLQVDLAASDPEILAFADLMAQRLDRLGTAAEKIRGQVLDVTKIILEAFGVQKSFSLNQANSVSTFVWIEDDKARKWVVALIPSPIFWLTWRDRNRMALEVEIIPFTGLRTSSSSQPIVVKLVLVEYRNKDPNHVEWAKALKELFLPGLRDYVKSNYPLGPVWSATGKAVAAPSKAPTASAPAPPPAPPASLFSSESSKPSSSSQKQGMSAVFKEINSKAVTSGLRKVTNDMKTKNRADRTSVVGAVEKERTTSPSFSKAGPPKLELQMGRKWVVENQIGRKNLVIDDCDAKQSVYVFGCKDSVLQIQGKVNNITVDKCTKMGVVFLDVVAACEIVNCNGVEVQCQGSAPTISVDNTGGCQLYLSKDALGTSITTAKSSEINVMVPGTDPDGDWVEHALPQQFSHVMKDGKFETTPVSHSGG
ncbi:LOW QUALITY PROTEIN: cyclase-associated protein 1 [Carica papaya]|uniref:LOW QUALITY PROTEIN: cyclase-associated protein 1 n=1 Tax=Carica papaya TaxID=3649 RepID=UPI000B8C8C2D|nr:LOW QUALITY PROTEIN: cyclase-associated protein 1 [Carica papaya]